MLKGSKELGRLLRMCRGEMSQQELADLLFIDRSTVSKLESGTIKINWEVVTRWVVLTVDNWERMKMYADVMMMVEEKLQKGA